MLIYLTKSELDEIYKALMLYEHYQNEESKYMSYYKFLSRKQRIEDLLNKITDECMYYSDIM